ncbi:excinuclease ABC subunit A [Flexibacter flexilis DSM 6793]|uniref:UvrABC system protein A n=1 Tax=Flexibacter flexilis DSM 6793 TaxID=927664 RepID=A0A1I1DJT4_9BACT|nr:excinuclease ABC subunit UvrA [Flexibacter flexilis]SFB72980.1 excinuclease ABC subunit A [Flexibacter flexilis DSM 6793]
MTTASQNAALLDTLSPKDFIIIKGAKVNNLKNLSVAIPRYKLVVVTGLSGSGKSSLAFDTLFAEGQRMYVESLSSYARQFLGRMEKPEVEYIKGVSPAIAIEQKVNTRNPRSTVGTTTEIYDYFKLLFARIGKTYSPVSGQIVRRDSVGDVVNFIQNLTENTRLLILAPLVIHEGRSMADELKILLQKGFTRIVVKGETLFIEELTPETLPSDSEKVYILIDRTAVKHNDDDNIFRLSDSVQTAFYEGSGSCVVDVVGDKAYTFSDKFELDGIAFEEPSVNLFSFNNPFGACKTCEGFGRVLGLDPDLIIPDKTLSVFDGAIAPWRGEGMREEWLKPLLRNGIRFDFPIHRAYEDLTEAEKEVLWTGNKYFGGLNSFFEHLESQTIKIQYRVMLSRYKGKTSCPDCKGSRLRKDAAYVKIGGKSITDLVLLPIKETRTFFETLELSDYEAQVARQILAEIRSRLRYMEEVGLGYLTLNRLTNTLSGGEFQRIKLATSLGSALVGSMYILDEPSIGLHPRDTQRLIGVLKSLRDLGNTVIVVEHEEEVMQAADQIIDIGPEAGSGGGTLVFQGDFRELNTDTATQSYTYKYLNGIEQIPVPTQRRRWFDNIEIIGARENNLKNISVKIPLRVFSVITGVSGSGKSTLIKKILYPALAKMHGNAADETGAFDRLAGNLDMITQVEFIDQNPIGKSSRSNPVTYIKAYDAIRSLFAEQALSVTRGYKPAHFSFNVDGGRCEVCQGEGETVVEMQFMADIKLKCESCHGKRFKQEILDVKYKDKDISDVLEMTIEDSLAFFADKPRLTEKLKPLQEVGLGYVRLGQSSSTLSGGEAQRVKLASFLGKNAEHNNGILFIFDEPTTGLHFHDISKLLKAMNALVENGNSVLVIEHNTEVIKCADWIIDLGPDGGDKGGQLCFEGTPEQMAAVADTNITAQFLKEKLI